MTETANIHRTDGDSLTVALPEPARDLYRRLHRMPPAARQFAFNVIEILKLGTVNRRPWATIPFKTPSGSCVCSWNGSKKQ